MAATLSEYLQSQDDLMREAALALPHQFSQCTYSMGPLRQAVYLCLSCPEARGLCSACSVACHTDHEQIELFPKRNFRCDCPTNAIAHPCTLHSKQEPENVTNEYGQNFRGLFCRCGRPYDAKKERETMIQCLACEDWFHESCCNLRERPSSREPSPAPVPAPGPESEAAETAAADPVAGSANDDAASEVSSSGLPPPLITGDEYESFVCGSCVSRSSLLKRWMGTPGTIFVARSADGEPWRRIESPSQDTEELIQIEQVDEGEGEPVAGMKRPLSPSAQGGPEAKRAKGGAASSAPCLVPPQHDLAKAILASLDGPDHDASLGAGDIFFTSGFRERWCRCAQCLPSLQAEAYLLNDEETYEPPEDPDLGLSLEELGMRALARIPRERAIDGIHAFNELRDDLVQFLRPFAQGGKVVGESDVRAFFSSLAESAKKGSGGA